MMAIEKGMYSAPRGLEENEDGEEGLEIEIVNPDMVTLDDGSVEIITPPNEFLNIKESFDKADLKYEFAELTMKAETEIELKGSDGERMGKILDFLEDLDDVQEVYTNVVIEDD